MTHLDTSARRCPPSSDGFTCRGCPQGSRRASCDACPARHVSAVTPSHDAALGTLRPGHAHTAHARRGTCRTGRWLQAGRAAQPCGCSMLPAPRGVLKAERRSESLRVCWHPVVPPRGLRRAQSPPSVSRLLGLPHGEPFHGMDVASAGRCKLLAAAAAFGWWPSVCAVRPLLSGSSS